MGGSLEVYTSLKQRRMFSYANVRKASYRGNFNQYKYSKKSNNQHDISIQVLCDLGNIPNLVC